MKKIVEWKGSRLAGIEIGDCHRSMNARIMKWKPN
jgi:hypothetical protein